MVLLVVVVVEVDQLQQALMVSADQPLLDKVMRAAQELTVQRMLVAGVVEVRAVLGVVRAAQEPLRAMAVMD
jgi:hypothetical protein